MSCPRPQDVSQTTVVASRTDSDSTVEVFVVRIGPKGLIVDQTDGDPNEEGHQVQLSDTGDTLVIVRVTSADGLGQRVYLALINKSSSGSPSTQVRDARATAGARRPECHSQLASDLDRVERLGRASGLQVS